MRFIGLLIVVGVIGLSNGAEGQCQEWETLVNDQYKKCAKQTDELIQQAEESEQRDRDLREKLYVQIQGQSEKVQALDAELRRYRDMEVIQAPRLRELEQENGRLQTQYDRLQMQCDAILPEEAERVDLRHHEEAERVDLRHHIREDMSEEELCGGRETENPGRTSYYVDRFNHCMERGGRDKVGCLRWAGCVPVGVTFEELYPFEYAMEKEMDERMREEEERHEEALYLSDHGDTDEKSTQSQWDEHEVLRERCNHLEIKEEWGKCVREQLQELIPELPPEH